MSLTGANAVIMLSQATLFPTPQQLQGFAADDVTEMDPVKILESLMGVDGVLSFGFVFAERIQNITLQANSVSNSFFDTINAQQQAVRDVYPLNGTITLGAIGLMFTCVNGGLENYNPMPPVKKIIGPRRYRIVWNTVTAVPII
jgi:hypothetical protein